MDNQIKVLIVDDSPELLDISARALKKGNFTTFLADNGARCLELIHTEKPDIALIDVMLPDTNGIELTKTIKSDPELSDLHIILVSSFRTNSQHASEGLEAGADGYIARPVNNRELLARVQAACRTIARNNAMIEKGTHYNTNQNKDNNQFLSTFLVNMSYEIRTPLNGILGFTELLKRSDLSGNEHQAFTNIIEKSGIRLLHIINKTIDFLQLQTGLVELYVSEANVNDTLEALYQTFQPEADKKGLALNISPKLPTPLCLVQTDHQKLHTILSALMQNAIKYTLKGSVEIGCIMHKPDAPAAMNKRSGCIFYVKDTGPGLTVEEQASIFEISRKMQAEDKTSEQGLSFSLAIAKAFAIKLGGDLWIESALNKGSTFYLFIPVGEKLTSNGRVN